MRFALPILAALLSGPAAAQMSAPCDTLARADAIVEPWEENSTTFANGAVRVALLDAIEPAVAAFHLLILHPPFDELGGRSCTVISRDSGLGYSGVTFDGLEADYDPATGLTLTVPAAIYQPEQSFQNSLLVTITVNQATGEVTVSEELGNE
ncbi:hypothetical protein [Thalassorhabdomicrobium marinisediminis]|uniref:Uncharacterized protein n=1 Tax=Thalassorhabdomicrobium marinisediminis TaxID=2170577 RepID=A0A2T7FW25_9RHOB|nr:hypothetical protein [Thalassorhabdomicrobium marinisediminis]PVA06373.1 hypothetical protein DC363_10745 [Thalassorhabdomicrobium marinisediminis]